MQEIGLPDYEAHKNIHDNLKQKVMSFKNHILLGTVDKRKFIAFLQNWLVSHIQGVDKRYGEYQKQSFMRNVS